MTTYAIIGSGAIGSALAERFHAATVDAVIANTRGADSLQSITDKFGSTVKAVDFDQAIQSDVLILAVPYDAVPEVASRKAVWDGRTIVDATNAIDFPAFKPRDLGGRLSSEIVAELFPGAELVKHSTRSRPPFWLLIRSRRVASVSSSCRAISRRPARKSRT